MFEELLNKIDISEDELLKVSPEVLSTLLKDRTTGKNIMWCTDDYAEFGEGFGFSDCITVERITAEYKDVIQPRIKKSLEVQKSRSRDKGEVFTPAWLCNQMNNAVDDEWFGYAGAFSTPEQGQWAVTEGKVKFPHIHKEEEKCWQNYVREKRMEITCGEAPYLVSRYDMATGEFIPVAQRIGLLDRKLRVISERTKYRKNWLEWAIKAVQSIYGFDWQGDNVLLARENLLLTVMEYYYDRWQEEMSLEWVQRLAEVISWNVWQMDGLKFVVPNSCHKVRLVRKKIQADLFDAKSYKVSAKAEQKHLEFLQGIIQDADKEIECPGCHLGYEFFDHTGMNCKIKNWTIGKTFEFVELVKKEGREEMTKKHFRPSVLIGNPPYQQDTKGAGRQATPLYNLFIESAKLLNPEYIVMITPSRWFSGGMGLDKFRENMIQDKRILKICDFTNAKDCFPNISIGGGVNFFVWNSNWNGDCNFTNIKNNVKSTLLRPLDEFPVLVRYNEAISIIRKVKRLNEVGLDTIISGLMPYGLNTSYRGVKAYTEEKCLKLHSSNDITYISKTEILKGFDSVDKYKVMVSKTSAEHAGEPGSDGRFRVIPSSMKVIGPGEVCTHSYFYIGSYDDKEKAENVMTYLKTNFVRFLMLLSISGFGLSKVVFNFVPVQDFSKPWTDEELYAKYGITDDEVSFIDSMIKPMDLTK